MAEPGNMKHAQSAPHQSFGFGWPLVNQEDGHVSQPHQMPTSDTDLQSHQQHAKDQENDPSQVTAWFGAILTFLFLISS